MDGVVYCNVVLAVTGALFSRRVDPHWHYMATTSGAAIIFGDCIIATESTVENCTIFDGNYKMEPTIVAATVLAQDDPITMFVKVPITFALTGGTIILLRVAGLSTTVDEGSIIVLIIFP